MICNTWPTHIEAALLRFVTQVIICFLSFIPPWWRIILILLTDIMDSAYLLYICKNRTWENDKYVLHDKVNDMIGYVLILIIIYKFKLLQEWKIAVLAGALALRIFQLPLYKHYRDIAYVICPDVFKELLLALFLLPRSLSIYFKAVIIGFVIMVKSLYEYHMHVKNSWWTRLYKIMDPNKR